MVITAHLQLLAGVAQQAWLGGKNMEALGVKFQQIGDISFVKEVILSLEDTHDFSLLRAAVLPTIFLSGVSFRVKVVSRGFDRTTES